MNPTLDPLRELQAGDLPVHGGRTLAYVYDGGDAEVDRIGREAVAAYAGSNALDPTAFPSLLTMENELVGFACGLLDAPDTVRRHGHLRRHRVGPARRTGRSRLAARRRRRRRMVIPSTAHAAFHKAAHYFGVRAVVVPGRTRLPCRRRGDGRRDRRHDRAGRGQRAVLRPRCRRPGGGDRGGGLGGGRPLPRRRLHRRLGAAVRRTAGTVGAGVDLRRRGRHLDLGRHPQVRLRAQGHLAAAAPRPPRCGARSSSPPPPGRATRCSTRRSSRHGPADRSPGPGRSSRRSATTATSGWPARSSRRSTGSSPCHRCRARAAPRRAARTRPWSRWRPTTRATRSR